MQLSKLVTKIKNDKNKTSGYIIANRVALRKKSSAKKMSSQYLIDSSYLKYVDPVKKTLDINNYCKSIINTEALIKKGAPIKDIYKSFTSVHGKSRDAFFKRKTDKNLDFDRSMNRNLNRSFIPTPGNVEANRLSAIKSMIRDIKDPNSGSLFSKLCSKK